MSVIHINRSHTQDLAFVRSHANEIVEHLSERFNINYQWNGDTVTFKGAGAKGFMAISGSAIEVKIEVSFLLRAFKSRIEKEITQNLDEFCS